MAYLIFSANGIETERRELPPSRKTPLVIGRAPDCDIPVPDILLSRHHCQLEHSGDDKWVVLDLGSKNGTYLGNKQISRHVLTEGDALRMGPRTRVVFRAGEFEPNPLEGSRGASRAMASRPVDPHEALEGTLSGFLLVEPGEAEIDPHMARAPRPQPKPPEPDAYTTEDVYGMLSELMSSSWDSIREQASKPIVGERPVPRPGVCAQPKIKRKPAVSMSLQAQATAGDSGPGSGADDRDAVDRSTVEERAGALGDSIAGMKVVDGPGPAKPPSPDDAPGDERLVFAGSATRRSEERSAATKRGRLASYFRRPAKPGRRATTSKARCQRLLALAAIGLTAVLLVGWSVALYIMPQHRRSETIKVDIEHPLDAASSTQQPATVNTAAPRLVYGPQPRPLIYFPRQVPFAPVISVDTAIQTSARLEATETPLYSLR